jgi:hypothetical protein
MPAQRGKLADRDSIPGHDEPLALVKLAHNVAAVVTQLPLGDLLATPEVWHACYRCSIPAGRQLMATIVGCIYVYTHDNDQGSGPDS